MGTGEGPGTAMSQAVGIDAANESGCIFTWGGDQNALRSTKIDMLLRTLRCGEFAGALDDVFGAGSAPVQQFGVTLRGKVHEMATNRQRGGIHRKYLFWGEDTGTQRPVGRIEEDLVDDVLHRRAGVIDRNHTHVLAQERITE